ncbi:hypothetical protein [Streptomyces sp. S186]|uniref:hypothetical protein n=1 Tax=Streptomyces sp. S186 TaxID=3434395 RepID=UPI003F6796F8
MDKRIATISGTMLTPGVSRNRRLYTKELIAKAVGRMQERLADPNGLPITMRSHHEAGDDSTRIVGALRDVKVGEDGAAHYTADLYDTTHGRDIAALITGKQPALRSVSIHGYWLGPVKRIQHEGESVSSGTDLEIDSLDFTATPGVLGASVATASYLPEGEPAESTAGRTPIRESVDATVEVFTEEAPVDEYSAKQKRAMVKSGQAMKNASGDPSYPIKSKADLRRAIRAVGRGGADHDKIRAHITKRATDLGLSSMIPDNWNKDGSMKESDTRYSDVREYYDGPGGAAGFAIDAFNGPTSITIRNCQVDPAELRVIAAAAMDAVANALQQIDPDMDADVDVDGAPATDTGSDAEGASGESAPAQAPTDETASTEPTTEALTAPPDQGAATTTTEEEAAMGEPTETDQTTAAPAARSLTDADISALGALFGAALKENLAPVTAALAENAPKASKSESEATETTDAKPGKEAKESKKLKVAKLQETVRAEMAELKESLREELLPKVRDELREELLRENGLPARKGYRVHENDQSGPDETSPEDLYAQRAELLLGDFGRTPQPAQ